MSPTRRMNAVIQAPTTASIQVKGIRQDANAYLLGTTSPPRTPPRRRKDPPSSYPKSARLAAATGAIPYDDSHGYESHSANEDDAEDPHDLTYHPKHSARASMVDNMVMALDQLSNPSSEQRYYDDNSRSIRGRGHTFSSSVSSESDLRSMQPKTPQPHTKTLVRRSSARYARDPQKLPSIFGEDEDNTRVRVFEAQRSVPAMKPKKQRRNATDPGKANGTTSDLDLSQVKCLQGRLGPAGNRRSQSFDFGSRRVFEDGDFDDDDDNHDPAPHRVVYSEPETQKNPGTTSLQGIPLGRRGSTKSAKGARNKSSALGTSTAYGPTAPPVPPANPPLTTPSGKGSSTPQSIEHNIGPRSGLFKRFFGSSRNLAPIAAPPSTSAIRHSQDRPSVSRETTGGLMAANRLQKQAHKDSIDISNKENFQPMIAKKPSSFFRRRKKSVSTSITPYPHTPLALDATLAGTETQLGEPSPISSLKAFIDPYSPEDRAHRRSDTPTSPLRGLYMPGQDSTSTGLSRTESSEPTQSLFKDPTRLDVPDKSAYVTDNSSVDDTDNSHWSDIERLELQISNVSRTSAAPSADANHIYPTIRPVIQARSTSWHSDRPGVPPRKDSLLLDISRTTSITPKLGQTVTGHDNLSGSDVSDYRSAPSTPAVHNVVDPMRLASPRLHVSHPSLSQSFNHVDVDKAKNIFEHSEEDIDGRSAAAWLGEAGSDRERIRKAYMELFDWTGLNIVTALRSLCSRLALKAESQLIDRLIDAFAKRWCECNPNHGFKSADVVHTICYSVFLLNTDLHMVDMSTKMTRNQFIKNAMQTIRPVAADAAEAVSPTVSQFLAIGPNIATDRMSSDRESSRTASSLGHRPTEQLSRADSNDTVNHGSSGPLVEAPFLGSQAGWEVQIETVLKEFYFSIQKEPLPLFGSDNMTRYPPCASHNNLLSLSGLRRTPSVLSKAQSESNRSRYGDSKSLGSKWNSKARSRPRIGSTPGFGSSKNSLEDQSSAWSPSISSTWSKASLGKTLTSMSVDSFATSNGVNHDYQSSIGFANALSQAIIREDQIENHAEDGSMKAAPLLEDESLELEGAPWAKEGILKHKCHLEGVEKRSKDRNWNDCFAVIEKGWMRLFSFSVTAKSLRTKARSQKASGVVGGGNWQDNAEEVWKFMLRHTIASSLPPPGYSKARPHVWALSLPTGAVHLFSAGTPDIVKEFVSTANFWSARLSKEPMIGGVSSMEYGWSDAVINQALTGFDVRPSFALSDHPRPSTQMSVRSSLDPGGSSGRPKLPGDRIHISDWTPPQQSLLASQLMEVDQLKALQTYVQHVEEDLQKHNELRGPMLLAFSSKGSNYSKAMNNWEKKSSYLLREIVKFKNYIDALQCAHNARERIYKLRREETDER